MNLASERTTAITTNEVDVDFGFFSQNAQVIEIHIHKAKVASDWPLFKANMKRRVLNDPTNKLYKCVVRRAQ